MSVWSYFILGSIAASVVFGLLLRWSSAQFNAAIEQRDRALRTADHWRDRACGCHPRVIGEPVRRKYRYGDALPSTSGCDTGNSTQTGTHVIGTPTPTGYIKKATP
jgi:hypothetical protein